MGTGVMKWEGWRIESVGGSGYEGSGIWDREEWGTSGGVWMKGYGCERNCQGQESGSGTQRTAQDLVGSTAGRHGGAGA